MKPQTCIKESFCVIGKEGSTDEELIKLGYTSEAIESAKETLKLILA